MSLLEEHLWVTTVLAAELAFLLARSPKWVVALKSLSQRTDEENAAIMRGLLRALLIEGALFVPASASLVFYAAPALPASMHDWTSEVAGRLGALHVLLGIVSYGFPFATIRAMVTRMALKTLQEFALAAQEARDEQT